MSTSRGQPGRSRKLTIKPNVRLDQGTLDNLGEWTESDDDRLIVDLTTVRFVDSYAMVVLVTLMTLWRRSGWPVELRLPDARPTRNYLARMRFFSMLPGGVRCHEPLPTVTENPSLLIPLTKLDVTSGESAVDELARFVHPQLPRQLASWFVEAMAEIAGNVLQHAQSDIGFLAAQRFEKDFQGLVAPRLQLVVADAGIGIKDSLVGRYPDLQTQPDTAAIELALKAEVTSKPSTNSGVGLSTVDEYARAFGGVLRVRSGAGVVVHRRTGKRVRQVPYLPGTVVAVELASPGRRR